MNITLNYILFMGPSGPELLLILLVLLLLFGAKDAPKIMRKISDGMMKFRHTANEFKHDIMYSDMKAEADERGNSKKIYYSEVDSDIKENSIEYTNVDSIEESSDVEKI